VSALSAQAAGDLESERMTMHELLEWVKAQEAALTNELERKHHDLVTVANMVGERQAYQAMFIKMTTELAPSAPDVKSDLEEAGRAIFPATRLPRDAPRPRR
jgi:hypothetical protein